MRDNRRIGTWYTKKYFRELSSNNHTCYQFKNSVSHIPLPQSVSCFSSPWGNVFPAHCKFLMSYHSLPQKPWGPSSCLKESHSCYDMHCTPTKLVISTWYCPTWASSLTPSVILIRNSKSWLIFPSEYFLSTSRSSLLVKDLHPDSLCHRDLSLLNPDRCLLAGTWYSVWC